MSRPSIDTAIRLLNKAQSTSSEPEAMALIERCYELLAQVLNANDERNPRQGPRRRERRLRIDRRRRPEEPQTDAPADSQTVSGRMVRFLGRYHGTATDGDDQWDSGVDVSL